MSAIDEFRALLNGDSDGATDWIVKLLKGGLPSSFGLVCPPEDPQDLFLYLIQHSDLSYRETEAAKRVVYNAFAHLETFGPVVALGRAIELVGRLDVDSLYYRFHELVDGDEIDGLAMTYAGSEIEAKRLIAKVIFGFTINSDDRFAMTCDLAIRHLQDPSCAAECLLFLRRSPRLRGDVISSFETLLVLGDRSTPLLKELADFVRTLRADERESLLRGLRMPGSVVFDVARQLGTIIRLSGWNMSPEGQKDVRLNFSDGQHLVLPISNQIQVVMQSYYESQPLEQVGKNFLAQLEDSRQLVA